MLDNIIAKITSKIVLEIKILKQNSEIKYMYKKEAYFVNQRIVDRMKILAEEQLITYP